MNHQQLDRQDRLVEDYLGAVSWACGDLPPQRCDELVEDLREHVAAARSVLYEPTEAAVRTILDRLGEPAAIAEEARLAEGLGGPVAPTPTRLATPPSPVTLGMLLGFVLIIIAALAVASYLIVAPWS